MSVRLTRARPLLLVALAGIFALPGTAVAHPVPEDGVVLDVVTVNGSGCPPGTAEVGLLPDNTGFRVAYREFMARAGGGSGPVEFRKNCQLNVLIRVPEGFTYAIGGAEFHGRARLAAGASALHRTNYYFQGLADNHIVDHPFAGPFFGKWQTSDVNSGGEDVYAPCGALRGVNINTELRVYEGSSDPNRVSTMSMTSTGGDVDTLVHFDWKPC